MQLTRKNKLFSAMSVLSILLFPIIGCTAASHPNGPAASIQTSIQNEQAVSIQNEGTVSIQESAHSEGPAAQTLDSTQNSPLESSSVPHLTISLPESTASGESQNPVPSSAGFDSVSLINPDGSTLQDRILPPSGFTRIEQAEESLGTFLRNYPLLPDQSPVLLFDGREKGIQTDHVAVFDMHLSNRDLQQCADSVIRIYAEYFWNTRQYEKIAFHFVNGFLCSYDTWRQGYRVKIQGNQVQWTQSAVPDTSWETFESYLNIVFAYSSTLSMYKESEPADLSDMQIGDVFLRGGSPGHVVMIVDMCANENGETAFLLAQGYMPAQQFHILKNPVSEENPWYYTSALTWPFCTPEYIFDEGSFRRLTYQNPS